LIKKSEGSHLENIEPTKLGDLLENHVQLTENFLIVSFKNALNQKIHNLEKFPENIKSAIKNYIFKKFEILDNDLNEDYQTQKIKDFLQKVISVELKKDPVTKKEFKDYGLNESEIENILEKVNEAIKVTYIEEIKKGMRQLGEKEFNDENSDNNLVNEIDHLINKINLEDGDFNLEKFKAEFDKKMNNYTLSFKKKVEEIKTKNVQDQFLTKLLLKTNKKIEKKLDKLTQKVLENAKKESDKKDCLDEKNKKAKKERLKKKRRRGKKKLKYLKLKIT